MAHFTQARPSLCAPLLFRALGEETQTACLCSGPQSYRRGLPSVYLKSLWTMSGLDFPAEGRARTVFLECEIRRGLPCYARDSRTASRKFLHYRARPLASLCTVDFLGKRRFVLAIGVWKPCARRLTVRRSAGDLGARVTKRDRVCVRPRVLHRLLFS